MVLGWQWGINVPRQAANNVWFSFNQVPLPDGHTSNHLPLSTDNNMH